MDMNIVVLQGRLAADPAIKTYTKEEKEYRLARICLVNQPRITNNQNYKSDEEPHPEPLFIYATAFGSIAKYIEKTFKKGSRILIYGELLPNTYERNGEKISGQQLIIRRAYFDGLNRGNQNSTNSSPYDPTKGTKETSPPESPMEDAFLSVSPEELSSLPFADIQ